jgi:hypothetical protein
MSEVNEPPPVRPAAPAESSPMFDPFELFVAICLGLGATGGAIAAYQGDLWGGQSVEAYGEAATRATAASTDYNEGITDITYDQNVDVSAKTAIIEGIITDDPVIQARAYSTAAYLYEQQLSDEAYEVVGLNPRYRQGEERFQEIPEAELHAALETELWESEEYEERMLEAGNTGFEEADAMFDRGREANNTGDEFAFMGILFTVALFLSGIALVFKTRVKWGFAAIGAIVLIYAFFQLATTPWAGGEAEAQEEPAEEEPAEEEEEEPAPEPEAEAPAPEAPAPEPAAEPAADPAAEAPVEEAPVEEEAVEEEAVEEEAVEE